MSSACMLVVYIFARFRIFSSEEKQFKNSNMIIRRIECKESRASNIVILNAYDKIDTYLRSVRTWTIDCLYYMAYPMPLLYDDDRIARRDLDYMKSLYPAGGKSV